MSNRHLVRSIVLQSLFEWDFKDQISDIDEIMTYNIESFAPSLSFRDDFLQLLSKGVVRNIKKIDKIIKIYAPEWPINQISVVDRNILRISIFELIYNPSTPYKVVINEAIELAKNFSGEKSSKFINGVLGSVVNEIQKNIQKTYEIGFIIRNTVDNTFLFAKKDEKFKFFKINNDLKEAIEKNNDEQFIKEFEELKKKQEEKLKKKQEEKDLQNSLEIKEELEKGNISESIIESDELDKNEDTLEESLNDNSSNFLNFAKDRFLNIFELKSLKDIKILEESTYSIIKEDDKKSLFPNIQLKNIFFVFIDIEEKIQKNDFEWIDNNKALESIEYKNIKNSVNKIIQK